MDNNVERYMHVVIEPQIYFQNSNNNNNIYYYYYYDCECIIMTLSKNLMINELSMYYNGQLL